MQTQYWFNVCCKNYWGHCCHVERRRCKLYIYVYDTVEAITISVPSHAIPKIEIGISGAPKTSAVPVCSLLSLVFNMKHFADNTGPSVLMSNLRVNKCKINEKVKSHFSDQIK